jgi:hypothetical protein
MPLHVLAVGAEISSTEVVSSAPFFGVPHAAELVVFLASTCFAWLYASKPAKANTAPKCWRHITMLGLALCCNQPMLRMRIVFA